jgi:arabinogalactan oligomer / maltooligosaccharide transport system substrate-binding protein
LGGKSIWDLLNLSSTLAIPLVVVLATIGFGWWQSNLANRQNQANQQAALEQQNYTILQTYIGNMQGLLLTDKLATSAPRSEERQLALVQTLTTLRRLDASRNNIVLGFLRDAGLIGAQDPVINLSNTDLDGADLSGADLSGINLTNTDLSGANLNNADLSDDALAYANMTGANLTDANLSGASLSFAILTGAVMNGAHLTNATLADATLGDAHLDDATLTTADLSSADLTNADLSGADLSGADLGGTILTGTDVSGIDLSDANLLTAGLTQSQLDSVQSCTNAVLSLGLICNHKPPITLTYWYTESPAETPVIRRLILQFERIYQYIHINAVPTDYYQTEAAFEKAAKEGDAPDVLRSDVSWVAQFASQGYLQDIDSYIAQSDLSDYLNAPLRYDYYDGHLYGLPQVTDFLALLYNKAELRKAVGTTSAPATMNEFAADAARVVQSRAATYGFETDGTAYNVLPFLYAFGGRMFGQQDNILVNKPGSVAGLEFLLKLQNDYRVMPANVNYINGAVPSIIADFTNGKTAMIFGGPYDVPEILTGGSFARDPNNLGIADIPTCPDRVSTCRAGQTGTPSGGQSYVISAETGHPSEAYKFISFMSSTSSQVEIAEANHTLPTRKSAYAAVSGGQFISKFLQIMPTVIDQPAIPQAADLYDAFDPNVAAALNGVESPIAALNAVADAWKQLLAGS